MIAYEDFNRPQSLLSLGNGVRTTLGSAKIRYRIFKPDVFEIRLTSRDAHYLGAT